MLTKTRIIYLKTSIRSLAILFAMLLSLHCAVAQTTVTRDTPGNTSWTVPAGVTSIVVEAWGGGGGGGRAKNKDFGTGGGGGGAYARSVLNVTPGQSYDITVGAGGTGAGTASTFGTNLVVAAGGIGVGENVITGGAGGAASASTGQTKYSGGKGADGAGSNGSSGGGGGGAGTNSDGGNASGTSPGAGGTLLGGTGGAGSATAGASNPGSKYGGGGGGARNGAGNQEGGAGAGGCVRITYGGDLAITKTINNPTPTVGSNIIFTVTVTNNGPANVPGVQVEDLLPNGYTYVSHTPTQGTYTPGTGLWDIGNLNNTDSRILTFTAKINSTGSFNNIAKIKGNDFDKNLANNEARAGISSTNLNLCGIPDPTTAPGDGVYINMLFHEDFGTMSTVAGTKSVNLLGLGTGATTTYKYYEAIAGTTPTDWQDGNGPPMSLQDGRYTIFNKISETASWAALGWQNIGDHTNGGTTPSTGRMLIVNADYTLGEFYRRRLTGVQAGAPLNASLWIMNLFHSDAADASTSILPNVTVAFMQNGIRVHSYNTGDIPIRPKGDISAWNFYKDPTLFIPEFDSDIELILINNAPGGNGNDLAIDDIVVYQSYCVINLQDDINQTQMNFTISGNVLINDEYATQVTEFKQAETNIAFNTPTTIIGGLITVKTDGTYTFVPAPGFFGKVPAISYTAANSDNSASDTKNLYINVIEIYLRGQYNNPVANHVTATGEQGIILTVNPVANDSDLDAKTLTVNNIRGLTNTGTPFALTGTNQNVYNAAGILAGIAHINSGMLVFTPSATYKGNVPFTYTISNGIGGTDQNSTINITVTKALANTAYANDDAKAAPRGATITGNILINDQIKGTSPVVKEAFAKFDGTNSALTLGSPLSIVGVGSITVNTNGDYTFVPVPTFIGTLQVEYIVTNIEGGFDTATLYLTSVASPNYWIGTESTAWNSPSNWTRGIVPAVGEDTEFATTTNNLIAAINSLEVPANVEKTIAKLINFSDKALVVPAGSGVVVQGKVTGSESNPDKIVLQAASNMPNGTFIVDCASNTPNSIHATVQLYAKGYQGTMQSWTDNIAGSPTLGQTFSSSYKWQHFGVPVASVMANPTFAGGFLREYDETKNAPDRYYDKWHDLTNASTLTAFKGYALTQDAATTYTIKGALQFCDKTITLTRNAPEVGGTNTDNIRYGLGQNIFGNSFTAAIPINQIVFPDNVEKTVYLYNTGSFADWTGGSTSDNATSAGSYIALPSNVAPHLYYGKIPSMQGFLLRHMGAIGSNISMTLPYASVVKNDRPQTAPRQALSHIELELTSTSTTDRLWLFSMPGTSANFDNGWDGRKFFGTPTAFIYSPTPEGNMQVNTTNNILGTNIAFVANNDTQYVLKIRKTNIDDHYSQLYLYDIAEKKSIKLENDITTYHFYATNAGVAKLRFAISDNANGLAQNTEPAISAYVNNNTLYATNKTNINCTLQIRTITGQLLYSKNIAAMSLFSDNLKLPQGAYLIIMHSDISDFSAKTIIH